MFGDTRVLGANTVNSLRVSFNRTKVDRYNAPTVEPSDLGIKAFSYEPHRMNIDVAGVRRGHLSAGYGLTDTDAYQVSNDLTLVRGGHQLGFGATIAKWSTSIETRCGGQWNFNGQVTGLGLSDFLLGRVATMELGGPGGTDPSSGTSACSPRIPGVRQTV